MPEMLSSTLPVSPELPGAFGRGFTPAGVRDGRRWPLAARIGFRFAFLFLLLPVILVFAPFGWIPWLGSWLAMGTDAVSTPAAVWVGQHVFHLAGMAAQPHATDSRDTALGWITVGLALLLSVLGAAVWSVLDRRRPNYQTAAAWLRFVLRLSLVFLMLRCR